MDTLKRKRWTEFCCMIICIPFFWGGVEAQQTQLTQLPSDINRNGAQIPVFTEREPDVGSLYLSRSWISGKLELLHHSNIPDSGQVLLFNFDKVHSRVYVINQTGKQWFYPVDSVVQFELVDNNVIYTFQKLSWISLNFFLSPVIKSEKGYSLYKRLFTKCTRSAYENAGYYSTGSKYDEYVDYYVYYLIYPGNSVYRKLYLKENTIRRAFRDEARLIEKFFDLHDNDISEESLLAMVQYINDKKFPD